MNMIPFYRILVANGGYVLCILQRLNDYRSAVSNGMRDISWCEYGLSIHRRFESGGVSFLPISMEFQSLMT